MAITQPANTNRETRFTPTHGIKMDTMSTLQPRESETQFTQTAMTPKGITLIVPLMDQAITERQIAIEIGFKAALDALRYESGKCNCYDKPDACAACQHRRSAEWLIGKKERILKSLSDK